MDLKISGSSKIASGEYENIRINGSSHLNGLVRCLNFHASGSSKGYELECKNELKVSGSSKFLKSVKSGNLSVSGAFYCGGDMIVEKKLSCSGIIKVDSNIKCTSLLASGAVNVNQNVEAENVEITGKFNCAGLLNAENIDIKFNHSMEIGSIGGSKIIILKDENSKTNKRMPLLSLIASVNTPHVYVNNSIEGDHIALESVTAKSVSGRIVAIGEDCEIGLVQYSDQVEISPKAKVKKIEKI